MTAEADAELYARWRREDQRALIERNVREMYGDDRAYIDPDDLEDLLDAEPRRWNGPKLTAAGEAREAEKVRTIVFLEDLWLL